MRDLSKSLRKRLEGVASLDGEEVRKQLREEVVFECQEELRALRRRDIFVGDDECAAIGRERREMFAGASDQARFDADVISARPKLDPHDAHFPLPSVERAG